MSVTHISVVCLSLLMDAFCLYLFPYFLSGKFALVHGPKIMDPRVVCDGAGQDPLYMPTKKAGLFQVKMSMKMIQHRILDFSEIIYNWRKDGNQVRKKRRNCPMNAVCACANAHEQLYA